MVYIYEEPSHNVKKGVGKKRKRKDIYLMIGMRDCTKDGGYFCICVYIYQSANLGLRFTRRTKRSTRGGGHEAGHLLRTGLTHFITKHAVHFEDAHSVPTSKEELNALSQDHGPSNARIYAGIR